MNRKYQGIFRNQIRCKYIRLLLIAISIVAVSCGDAANDQNQPPVYFDLKGFIEGQIDFLNREKPMVLKTMEINKESNLVSSKEVDWKKELELFLQADINKSAYRQSYSIIRPDSLTYQYVIKKGEKLPVSFLNIKLNKPGGSPVKIEALLKSENKLYQSEKHIELACTMNGTSSRIVNYQIQGFQKLATMQRKPFKVNAKIKF